MQPENLSKPTGPEKMPSMPRPVFERPVENKNPELGVEKSAESFEQRSELAAASSDVFNTTAPVKTGIKAPDGITVDDSTTFANTPLVASDSDQIEKEWVDKAKKIISDTKEDPYQRDEEVSKLQVEYIKTRYGRSINLDE